MKLEKRTKQEQLAHCIGPRAEELSWEVKQERRQQFYERMLEAERAAAAEQALCDAAERRHAEAQRRLSTADDKVKAAALMAGIAEQERILSAEAWRNTAAGAAERS